MKIVKYICDKCGHSREFTRKEKIKNNIIKSVTTFFFVMGVFFVLYLLMVGINRPLNDVVNGRYNILNNKLDDEIRLLTIDITQDCDNSDSFCYAREIYENVSDSRYVLASLNDLSGIYDPIYVYKNGGDCKSVSNMIVAMMRSVGFNGYVDCDYKESHCIAVIPYTKNNKYLGLKVVIDLTVPMYVILSDNQKNWDYMEIYKNGNNNFFNQFWENG